MAGIKTVAIASGNLGTPITAALRNEGFDVTIISRPHSTTAHPLGIKVLRPGYTVEELTKAFAGQDAVVSVVGASRCSILIDAAEAAGVKRLVVDDFGWGPDDPLFPEFEASHAQRVAVWDHAKRRADANQNFTWTAITTGNPIDWAMKKFPKMGFDIARKKATIYDSGEKYFTGTTLQGIGQSVVGVMQHPNETKNRFVKVMSLQTCQNDLLRAFQEATGQNWEVVHSTTAELKQTGQQKHRSSTSGWVLDLAVTQLYDPGETRSRVARSWAETDGTLLGVVEETPRNVVDKCL